MKAATITVILVIFSLFVLAIVLTVVFLRVWPTFRYGVFSPCWASTVTDVNLLSNPGIFGEKQNITVGDCVSSFAFINKGELEDFNYRINDRFDKYAKCPDDKKSFIIAIPIISEDIGLKNPFKWPQAAWEKAKELWKGWLGGIKPHCKGLDANLIIKTNLKEAEDGVIESPGEGKADFYCISVKKADEIYEINILEGKCT